MPPASPPTLVATSSARPSRMFTRPRPRLTVADAEAVAITEIRLAAIAVRIGTPSAASAAAPGRRRRPRPSSAPTRPVAAPLRTRIVVDGSSHRANAIAKLLTSFHKCLWNNELRPP